jgi:hypothetical protein
MIDDFMAKWYNQPAREQIPDTPSLGFSDVETINSKILGCKIIIDAERKFPCVELGESILAALESFLATGISDRIMSITPVINLKIQFVESDTFKICRKIESIEDTKYHVVYCSGFNKDEFRKAQNDTKEFISQLIAELIARIAVFKDTELLEVWARDDRVFDRALGFNNSIFITEDLIGTGKYSIESLLTGDEFEYILKRKEPINIKCDSVVEEDRESAIKEFKFKDGKFDENYDVEGIGHKDIEIKSIINMELWDKAMWKGMLFAFVPGSLPIMAPVFTNIDAGKAIFAEWRKIVGKQDERDLISVGLIKNNDKNNPLFYKGIFTSNIGVLPKTNKVRYFTTVSRFRTMESTDNSYFLMFERILKTIPYDWKYWIAPGYIDSKSGKPEILTEYAILKNKVTIKEAWEIREDDWLSLAITPDDDPIIPSYDMKAPVMDIISRLKNRM